jgi:two-component system chemotaxis response regulator CheB
MLYSFALVFALLLIGGTIMPDIVVVIGGSFGATNALKVILAALPVDFPAAVLIATHIGTQRSMLPEILERSSKLPVRSAIDGEPLVAGRVFLAPSDRHLTVASDGSHGYVHLLGGPKENHCRPAIDPLFRSAAAAFGTKTIGVLLTGYLDDGTVGLQAVKARGGTAIVQDPSDAEAPDMPASALKHVDVDQKLPVDAIGPALVQLVAGAAHQDQAQRTSAAPGVPDWIDVENRLSAADSNMEDLEQIGRPSSLTCPECHGALWEIGDRAPTRYRCHTGHAFTAKVLEALQSTTVEDALWGAIRALHEQERLFGKLRESALEVGLDEAAAEYQTKAEQAQAQSSALRKLITARAFALSEL